MIINTNYVRTLALKENLSGAQLARKMGVSISEANRVLNGERKGGIKVMTGLMRAFPTADIDKLFILPITELKSSIKPKDVGLVPNLNYIKSLMVKKGWSGSDLARHMGVSITEANRVLRGARKGGKKVIGGLLKAFPEEDWKNLFINVK
ncbi:MAG: helix-turn-helix transcriptional regulator [Thermoanaerobacteraceae bacterium]|nr:helix-turn-helix transcriptional regulator [Thermoanaerobacteraceae bacterium]